MNDGMPPGDLLISLVTMIIVIGLSGLLLNHLASRNPVIRDQKNLIIAIMIASAIFGTCRIYAFQGMRMADQGRHHNQSRIVKQLYENGEPKVFDFATPGNQGFQFVNGMIYATFGECPNVLSQLYGFLGLAGALLLWDLICREFELLYARPFLCVMMIALPSVFFWCQGLWKEGPTFFAYCLMFQLCPVGTNKKTGSLSLGIIGSVIAMWLRPQMAIAYAAALVLTTLKERANLKVLVTTGVIMVAAFLLLQRLVPAFFAEPDALVSKLGSAYRVRVDADVGSTIGGSPIPILSGINLIFLRPYPFEISNQFMLVASVEVYILTGVIILGWTKFRTTGLLKRPIIFMASVSVLLLSFPFSYMYNLGLLSRQRLAVTPALLLLAIAPLLIKYAYPNSQRAPSSREI